MSCCLWNYGFQRRRKVFFYRTETLISGEEETVSEINEGINLVLYPRKTAYCGKKKGGTSSVAKEFSGVYIGGLGQRAR